MKVQETVLNGKALKPVSETHPAGNLAENIMKTAMAETNITMKALMMRAMMKATMKVIMTRVIMMKITMEKPTKIRGTSGQGMCESTSPFLSKKVKNRRNMNKKIDKGDTAYEASN